MAPPGELTSAAIALQFLKYPPGHLPLGASITVTASAASTLELSQTSLFRCLYLAPGGVPGTPKGRPTAQQRDGQPHEVLRYPA